MGSFDKIEFGAVLKSIIGWEKSNLQDLLRSCQSTCVHVLYRPAHVALLPGSRWWTLI